MLDHKYPEQLINHSIKKLEKFGIKKEDMKITDSPDDHLEIARVRTIRNASFISGIINTIELKIDVNGNYID